MCVEVEYINDKGFPIPPRDTVLLPPHLLFALSFKSFLFVVIFVVVVVTEQNPDAN